MNIRHRQVVLLLGDFALFYASLGAALSLRHARLASPDFYLDHLTAFTAVFACWASVCFALGLHDFQRMRNLFTLISDGLQALAANLALTVSAFYLFGRDGMTPKTNLLLTAFLAHAGMLAWRHLWVRLLATPLLVRRVAFLGDGPLLRAVKADLQAFSYAFRLVDAPLLGALENARLLGTGWLKELSPRFDLLVVDADELERDTEAAQAVVAFAIDNEVPLLTHLDFYEALYRKIPPSRAAKPGWLLTHVLPKDHQAYLVVKRAADLLAATAALLLLSPLLILICVLSTLLDRASPFYRQARAGYLGREFRIWKFRTMRPDADRGGPLWEAVGEDRRVTRFGAFLRRFRLDELPQLVNVVRGDMSLVGPRPEWIEEVRVLERSIVEYHLRHLVKPGITGWAQINFRATNSRADSVEKLHYDLYYVKRISLAMDLGILLKTAKRVFVRDEGFRRSAAVLEPARARRPAAAA